MTVVEYLPTVNAALNAISAILLTCGYIAIRRRRVVVHKRFMLGAFFTSTLFLISYVAYHIQAGSRPFLGQGWIRPVYFAMLISHVVLAAALLPLALVTLHRALRAKFASHRRWASWTLPIWIYVSVTGVLVYATLYHLYK